jgi:hypothetical protein
MRDVYVLRFLTSPYTIVAVTDDYERCNFELARCPRDEQRNLIIENHDLLEEGD